MCLNLGKLPSPCMLCPTISYGVIRGDTFLFTELGSRQFFNIATSDNATTLAPMTG